MALRFDLSSIPSPAKIKKAELALIGNKSYQVVYYNQSAFTIPSQWDASDLTWNNKPADGEKICFARGQGARFTFDVTDIVDSMVNKKMENNGFMLRTTVQKREMTWYSSRCADSKKWPELVIEYEEQTTENVLQKQVNFNKLSVISNKEGVRVYLPFDGKCKIQVHNIHGREYMSNNSNGNFSWHSIPFNYSPGVYIISVSKENLLLKESLFIK